MNSVPSLALDRTTVATFDSIGRLRRVESEFNPICIEYVSATSRRMSRIVQAPFASGDCDGSASQRRRVDFEYDSNRWLSDVYLGASTATPSTSFIERTQVVSRDGRGWPIELVPNGAGSADHLQLGFDQHGNLTWIETPGHSSTQRHLYTYTGRDGLLTYSSTIGKQINNVTYSLDGEVERITFRDGRVIDPVYDAATGLMTSIVGAGSTYDRNFTVAMDEAGRVEYASDGVVALQATYDGPVLQKEEWNWSGGSGQVTHNVDTSGLLASENVLLAGYSRAVGYGYDGDGVLESVVLGGGGGSALTIFDASSHVWYVDSGSVYTDLIANDFGEFSSINTFGSANFISRAVCSSGGRDELGRIVRVQETVLTTGGTPQTRVEEYEYDDAGRLARWRRDSGCVCSGSCTAAWTTYPYNAAGNRTDWSPNAEDQHNGGSRTYNLMGQTVARTHGGLAGTLTHDRFGRLRRFLVGSDSTVYDYDITGRLIRSTRGSTYERFVYRDGLNPIAWHRHTASTDDLAYFGYGTQRHTPDVMWLDSGANGTIDATYRIVSDERGSVRLLINVATGVIAQRIDYDPWGTPTITGTTRLQPFAFGGGIWLDHPELVRFGARDYDPEIGRWTTKDPILHRGGLSLYEYCGSDPVNCGDPSGLFAVPMVVVAAGVGAIAGGAAQAWADSHNPCGIRAGAIASAMVFGAVAGVAMVYVGSAIAAAGLSGGSAIAANVGAAAAINGAAGVGNQAVHNAVYGDGASHGLLSAGAYGAGGGAIGTGLGFGISRLVAGPATTAGPFAGFGGATGARGINVGSIGETPGTAWSWGPYADAAGQTGGFAGALGGAPFLPTFPNHPGAGCGCE